MGELRELRERFRRIDERLANVKTAHVPRSAYSVGQVFAQTAVPTSVPAFFACHPCQITPGTTEGSAATVTVLGGTQFIRCIGPGVPVAGDYLIGSDVAWRWVARKGGGGGGGGGPCLCPVTPDPLYYTYVMGATVSGTMHRGLRPAPPAYTSWGLPLSSAKWYGETVHTSGLDHWIESFNCTNNTFMIEYVNSIAVITLAVFGGVGGNTCTPFVMTHYSIGYAATAAVTG